MPSVQTEYGNGLKRKDVVNIRAALQAKTMEQIRMICNNLGWPVARWSSIHGSSTSTFKDAQDESIKYKFSTMLGSDGKYHVALCLTSNMRADPTNWFMHFIFSDAPQNDDLWNAVINACNNYSN